MHKDERLQVKLPNEIQNLFPFRFFLSRDFNSRKFPGVFQGSGETFECSGDEKRQKKLRKLAEVLPDMMREIFSLLKVDKSEQEKIYAKIYTSKLPNQDFSCRFWQLCGAKKKKPIPHPTKLINMPLRGQVVFSVKHLFCGNVKTITCIVDEVLVEEVVQSVSAFADFEDRNESDLESDEDF